MAETDWFNKPVENSRELILKEAFKLFLQKNVEKVTVPELERVTKLQRGAIFYHFKDKEAIFKDAVKQYFFSPLNIFYPINSNNVHSLEEYWGYWSRYIYINRYMNAPKPVYENLLRLVQEKDYFVLTTNVDHCFQKAGFDKHRMFYTQGDYGLWQCSRPCHHETYDNRKIVEKMVEAQGYTVAADGTLLAPQRAALKMTVPSELVPHCPKCGAPMTMNLRADSTFVEDDGWHKAASRYDGFIRRHQRMKVLFLELGVGYNTPGIIKYPFWQMTAGNPKAVYACINYRDAACQTELQNQAICIEGDIERL